MKRLFRGNQCTDKNIWWIFDTELVTEKLLSSMNTIYKKVSSDGFQIQRRELEYLLAQEVTGRERYLALALLSKRFEVELYSADIDERLKDVVFQGYTD